MDERAAAGIAVARAIDAEQPIPFSSTVRSHRFDDFFKTLTPKRFELLKLSQAGKCSITELAIAAGRDRRAVSRDIATLVDLGLVSVFMERPAGQRARKMIRPVLGRIEINATPVSTS